MKSEFLLDPEVIYLNHGSFGACPKPIFEKYQYWQRELEREPVQFILKKGPEQLKKAKAAVGRFINCDPSDFFFTPNPTYAINTIMHSLELNPGDEILATDNEYGAMDRTWNFFSRKTGVKYVRQPVSLPVVSKEAMIEEFWKGLTDKTKVVFLNQISSATALIFPVQEIVGRAKELGLITIVDGAHVPGHIPLDLRKLDADYYTGTLHKWMLAPKGSSFLYVRKTLQDSLDPLVVSWGYDADVPGESQFLDYHEMQGTRDISAFLCAEAVVEFLETNDWKAKADFNKQRILDNYQRFCDLVGSEPIAPVSPDFLGQMCSIPIRTEKPTELKALLFEKYRIEIPVMPLNGRIYLRISTQVYVSEKDLETLYGALSEILATTDLIRKA